MKFDSVERKKQEKKKPRGVRKEIDRLTKVYPVAGIHEKNYVKLSIRGQRWYAAFFDTKKYDLELLDESEADFVTDNYWSFQKQYGNSVKELFMNFPEENQKQQNYVKYKRDRSKDINQMRILQTELEKLKYIEKTYKKLTSYVVIFGRTINELEENISNLKRFDNLFQAKLLKKEYVKKMLYILNNTGGIQIYDNETENN
ncbi:MULTISPECIES: hypothetical protein [Enterococcaceae]|uniref:Uncharacterized protein n=1 Tax=Vagococcus vulneris TaxID=1977869 RepID=A0A430A2H2_9ENTE|nr:MULTISPECIES: hypothetical protein [Enterococcaceae]EJE4563103.1 hypothetical protein [Enterococcus faecium]EJX53379.1 hypothetical protein HMPREF1379_01543 [Enterococcus faecium R497]EKY7883045.1 hypothetical protein [Enterococcus faecium]EKZ0059106.1 hypothetical protein [Enterococcus faecium]EKZ0497596.1 hypothetical protein [Enterococcus faecium]